MFGLFRRKAEAPPPPLAELFELDRLKFYAACLVLLLLFKLVSRAFRRSYASAVARKGATAPFKPLLCKDAAAPAGSKGKVVVIGGGGARLPPPRARASRLAREARARARTRRCRRRAVTATLSARTAAPPPSPTPLPPRRLPGAARG